MQDTEITYGLDELETVATRLLELAPPGSVIALEGELGAGKTTLVSVMCRLAGTQDAVHSPTFSIVNQYDSPGGIIYHLDAYRLESLGEALDAGLEEIFDGRAAYVFVEWPEVIEPLLPEGVVSLRLSHGSGGGRQRHLRISTDQPAR